MLRSCLALEDRIKNFESLPRCRSQVRGSGRPAMCRKSFQAVPEPASVTLLASGVAALAWWRRKRC